MKQKWITPLACLSLGILAISPARAALTYPGCADVKTDDFKVVSLISNATDKTIQEPIKMAFDMDAAGNVDVYFTQRYGKIRKYDGAKKALVTLTDFAFTEAQVSTTKKNSSGINGIALDPDFKTNHWLYLYFGLDNDWRVSRFIVNGDKIDPTTERVIFKFDPGAKNTTHVAGALKFDTDGNLWITVTENEAQTPSANTNSYMGKILRVKLKPFADNTPAPAPGVGGTYDIPAGNLYPVGTAKTLPEIYIMGARNPYTVTLDPVRKAVAWGDIGPDGYGVTEEFNIATQPGYYGYPFWAGNQKQLGLWHGTPDAPTNTFPDNTGLTNLKPAITATLAYQEACAITGPIYYYDGALKSPYKFPPHFNGAWFIGDFNYSWIDALELDKAGTKILSRMPLFTANAGGQLNKPTDIQMGPDGAMYIMNYSGYRTWNAMTGLLRVEYHGTCSPVTTSLITATVGSGIRLERDLLSIDQSGPHEVAVWSSAGKAEIFRKGSGPARYDFRSDLGPGLHLLRVSTESGVSRFKIVR